MEDTQVEAVGTPFRPCLDFENQTKALYTTYRKYSTIVPYSIEARKAMEENVQATRELKRGGL